MSNITKAYYHPEFTVDSLFESMRLQLIQMQQRALNRVLTVAPALVIGSSSKADIRVNAAVDYVRDGIRRTQKAAAEVNVPSGATMTNDGTARSVYVVVYINGSDAFAAVAGTPVAGGGTPTIPDLPAGGVLLGYVKIAAAAGTAYTADSTLLDAAGITATYTNALEPYWMWEEPARAGYM